MATLNLYPKYITSGASFSGILSVNGTGEDYRSISPSGLDVGTIAFDTSPLHDRSSACIFTGYSVSYRQRCNINQWSKLYWKMTPKKVTSYSLNGNEISIRSSITFGRNTSSDTTGDGWLDFGKSFIDSDNLSSYSSSAGGLFGGTSLLGFFLRGDNDHSVGDYKLYMQNLKATVSYTPRYIASFYDENGNYVYSETLDSGAYPNLTTARTRLAKEGYTITGFKVISGNDPWQPVGTIYSETLGPYAPPIGSGSEYDIGWQPIYTPVTYQIDTYPSRTSDKPGFYIEKEVNGVWNRLTPTSTRDYNNDVYAVYSCSHGDNIRLVADGYRIDQDVYFYQNPQPSEKLDGSNGWPVIAKTINGVTGNIYFGQSGVVDVKFAITTSKTGTGFITATRNAPRGSAALVAILPDTGWLLSTYTVDGVEHSATQYEQTNGKQVVWQSVDTQHTVSAVFVRQPIQITSTLPNGVTVKDGNGNTVTFPDTVYYGDNKTYVFSCANTKSLLTITADGTNMMDPVFKQVTSFELPLTNITNTIAFGGTVTDDLVTITIQNPSHGTITGDSGKFVKQAAGSTNTLSYTIAVDAGYGFVKWSDNSTARPLVITPTADQTITATLEELDYKVNASVSGTDVAFYGETQGETAGSGGVVLVNGTECAEDDDVYIKTADTIHIEAVAADGFDFVSHVYYYGSDTSNKTTVNTASFDINGTVQNITLQTNFQRKDYTVSIAPNDAAGDDGCSIEITPKSYFGQSSNRYFFESQLQITAAPVEGWYFDGWSDTSNRSATRHITVPANNVSIAALFKKFTFTQDIEVQEGGKATIDDKPAEGQKTVEYGDDLTLTITANYGQKIKDVLLDGNSIYGMVTLTRRGGTLLLQSITANHSIVVVFEAKTYTNNRKLLDYYPPVIASILDIQALMKALQVQNDGMWDAMSFIFENQYIDTATNEGVTMWERELGIIPGATDTLQQRKERLRIKWVPKNRFTMRWLEEWLCKVCGQDVRTPILTDYSLRVTLPSGVDWMSIFNDLKQYKPANIVLDPRVLAPRTTQKIYVGTAILVSNHSSPIIHELTVEGE